MSDENREIQICEMHSADIAAIFKIQTVCELSFWSEKDYFDELKREDSVRLIAKTTKATIGFIIMRLIKHECEIYNIGVLPDERQKGVGRLLLQHSMKLCNSKNIEIIRLEVRESNQAAIRLYKANDFQIEGRRKNFYNHPVEDALSMKLILKEIDT